MINSNSQKKYVVAITSSGDSIETQIAFCTTYEEACRILDETWQDFLCDEQAMYSNMSNCSRDASSSACIKCTDGSYLHFSVYELTDV